MLTADGTLTFAPKPNLKGTAQITLSLRDSAGGTDTSPPHTLEIVVNKPNPWHNNEVLAAPRLGALDVDGDGAISPIDAVLVINYLNAGLPNAIPPDAPIGGPGGLGPGQAAFLDTGGATTGGPDNFVTPIDAVLVINWLNAAAAGGLTGQAAEGEPPLKMVSPAVPAAHSPATASPPVALKPFSRQDELSALIALLAADLTAGLPHRRRR